MDCIIKPLPIVIHITLVTLKETSATLRPSSLEHHYQRVRTSGRLFLCCHSSCTQQQQCIRYFFCQQLTAQSLRLIIRETCSIWTHWDGDRNERRREWERTERWSVWLGLGWWVVKRDRQVHRGERNMVHLPYLILSGPWGVGPKTRREKERRALSGEEQSLSVSVPSRLSSLFSSYICDKCDRFKLAQQTVFLVCNKNRFKWQHKKNTVCPSFMHQSKNKSVATVLDIPVTVLMKVAGMWKDQVFSLKFTRKVVNTQNWEEGEYRRLTLLTIQSNASVNVLSWCNLHFYSYTKHSLCSEAHRLRTSLLSPFLIV